MPENKLRIIFLTHGGSGRALEFVCGLEGVEVVGVFIETPTPPIRSLKDRLKRSVKYDGAWETVKKFAAKILGGETQSDAESAVVGNKAREVEEKAADLGIPVFNVSNYHDDSSIALLKNVNADLGVIYGTNIIKESVFSIPRLGSINIHQGLAPIYRGGPTVFWELFNGEDELGITVHFVSPKVDTGDIILQRTLPLKYDFDKYGLDYELFLADFRAGLVEPSAQLMAEAVKQIADGTEQRTKQDISLGKRYRLPVKNEKDEMARRLKKRRTEFAAGVKPNSSSERSAKFS